MERIQSMTRFAEPDAEPAPVAECDFCNGEIFEGDDAYKHELDYFCSPECVADALTEKVWL